MPILLSTSAKAGHVDVTTRRNVGKRLPEIVATYNKIMGGVDLKDTKLYAYLSERRTVKWTTKTFFSLLGTAILNSYILYQENTSAVPKLRRLDFMIALVHSLVGDFRPKSVSKKRRTKEQLREAAAQADDVIISPPTHSVQVEHGQHVITKGTKRSCVGGHEKGKKTMYECSTCKVCARFALANIIHKCAIYLF